MKKILFGVLAASLLAVPAGAAEHTGTLAKIKSSGAITLGYREQSRPFSFVDDSGRAVGYSLDLCARVVETVKEFYFLEQHGQIRTEFRHFSSSS